MLGRSAANLSTSLKLPTCCCRDSRVRNGTGQHEAPPLLVLDADSLELTRSSVRAICAESLKPMTDTRASECCFFPVASNAHALVAGAPVESVRARLKVASLLYEEVLIETGRRLITAGPEASLVLRMPYTTGQSPSWETARHRHTAQAGPFKLAMGPAKAPGVPSPEPMQEVFRSATTMCWDATLEPFAFEFPKACDWISFGSLDSSSSEVKRVAEVWKERDAENDALRRLVPEQLVRSALIGHIADDLAAGACAGWDTSVDRYHGRVIAARFAADANVKSRGFALPILVPRVERLNWEDVGRLRRLPALTRLRAELRDVEDEVASLASGDDIETAVRDAYSKRLRKAALAGGGVRSIAGHALVNMLVGVGTGYATIGLALGAPVVGGAVGAAVGAVMEVCEVTKARSERAWIGAIGRIADASRE